jgi:transcriptional regulator with XRE-family HTH domain
LAVYQLREKVGISQTELAARVKMSQPAIARLERGDHMPSLTTLWRIAAALNSVIEMTPDHQVRFRIRRSTPIRKKRLRRSA